MCNETEGELFNGNKNGPIFVIPIACEFSPVRWLSLYRIENLKNDSSRSEDAGEEEDDDDDEDDVGAGKKEENFNRALTFCFIT
ncbi:hypothetical protein RUM44_012836 [Polyplax serrata]|uniref:Uncharacterized protein n=1 Tax=Polyplax serrata TaxID=468196 RepID=A0ABR1BCG3_POLSC